MKILALIPARGGSKRLPGKNIRILGGKPLLAWSIDICKDIENLSAILVSTDTEEIASVAKNFGALVPWLRPEILSTDSSTSVDVALHALDWYEENVESLDGLLLLQPTSPFRTKKIIQKSLELFSESFPTIVSVSAVHSHPDWMMRIEEGMLRQYYNTQSFGKRSQELEPAYSLNGLIYLIHPDKLRKNRSFYDSETKPIIVESHYESLDIDTLADFQFAEYLISNNLAPL
jgi:CMP-N,N'-diacetyllegionaminic acid synthase